jgi:hypothetical protein
VVEPQYETAGFGVTNKAASENPLGLGLVVVGAAALAISVFLPLVQPVSALRMVEDNTLIQHGGWVLLGGALGIVGSGYRASRGRGRPNERWTLIVVCVIAAGLVVLKANDKGLRTLYPVGPGGAVDTTQPGVVASLGIAIYVAGAGVAAAFMGALTFFQSAKDSGSKAATKKCPDCAEAVLADARVCKHCGYRFALAGGGKAPSKPTTNQPKNTHGLQRGDRVQVVAPGDGHDGKVGKVNKVLHT